MVIATAAGGGTKKAMKDITNTLFYWGVPYIKAIGFNVEVLNWQQVNDQKKADYPKEDPKNSEFSKKNGYT